MVGDDEDLPDKSLADTARRELLEETRFEAESMEELLTSPTSSGMTSECTHLFLATGLTRTSPGGGIGGENITVHLVPRQNIRTWLQGREAAGLTIDFKIHAALWAAGK